MTNTAMILASGRGERLRPLTDTQPKALYTIHDVPVIEYHIENLAQAGFKYLIINHAYLGGQIRQQLGRGTRWGIKIHYSPEPPGGLETGGGILNALPLLGNEPFLVVNADIFTDFDFAQLTLPVASLAHLVLVHKPPYQQQADFGLSKTHQLENEHRQYTFTGIACYHPRLFQRCKPGRFSITPLLRAMTEKKQVTGEVYTGRWIDVGSTERLRYINRTYSPPPNRGKKCF